MSADTILVEACVDSLASSLAAERSGAARLELCDGRFEGGTTPDRGMIAACKAAVSIPIFVMIRPRDGGFLYSNPEREEMHRDIRVARELGADGIVTGGLNHDGTIDADLVKSLVGAANDLPVTFHRAFDLTPDLESSIDLLIDLGVRRVLTSGAAETAADGATVLAHLVRRAGSKLTVVAGGGVRENNVRKVISASGVKEVHRRFTNEEEMQSFVETVSAFTDHHFRQFKA